MASSSWRGVGREAGADPGRGLLGLVRALGRVNLGLPGDAHTRTAWAGVQAFPSGPARPPSGGPTLPGPCGLSRRTRYAQSAQAKGRPCRGAGRPRIQRQPRHRGREHASLAGAVSSAAVRFCAATSPSPSAPEVDGKCPVRPGPRTLPGKCPPASAITSTRRTKPEQVTPDRFLNSD